MFSRFDQIQKKSGGNKYGRLQYLNQLVTEFQNSESNDAKRQIVANLANFAYDPVNHEFLTTLRVHILFSDCLNEADPSMVEFALGGLCNMIQQPICRRFVLENLSEKVVSLLNSSNVETVVSALTVLIFLLHDPKIKNAEIIAKVQMLAEQNNQVRIANLAKLFIRRAV